jgi:hypothetical protein
MACTHMQLGSEKTRPDGSSRRLARGRDWEAMEYEKWKEQDSRSIGGE